jgi:hypothetical protein
MFKEMIKIFQDINSAFLINIFRYNAFSVFVVIIENRIQLELYNCSMQKSEVKLSKKIYCT